MKKYLFSFIGCFQHYPPIIHGMKLFAGLIIVGLVYNRIPFITVGILHKGVNRDSFKKCTCKII